MRTMAKIKLFFILLSLVLTLVPLMQQPAEAVELPMVGLQATTAQNPFLDFMLDHKTYSSGGPFTVSFEWHALTIKSNDPEDPENFYGFATVVGNVYGSTTKEQTDPNVRSLKSGRWEAVSFTFENVGTYHQEDKNLLGNILRFGLYKANADMRIRNLIIKNNAGQVMYDLNNDETMRELIATTGLRIGLSEMGAKGKDYWKAGQFGTGEYSAYIQAFNLAPPTSPPQSTTIKPPTSFDPYVVCGSQTVKLPANIHTQLGYKDGKQGSVGHGLGFKDPYWKRTKLPEITLNGTLQIFESEGVQVNYISVFTEAEEKKQDYKVSELANLAPGKYTVESKVGVWDEVDSYGWQRYNLYVYAFILNIPERNVPTNLPTTIPTTTDSSVSVATTLATVATTAQPQASNTQSVVTTLPAAATTAAIPTTQSQATSVSTLIPAQTDTGTDSSTQEQDSGYWIWVCAAAAAVITATVVFVIRFRRR